MSVHAMWEGVLFTPPSIAWDLKVASKRKTTNHFLFEEVPQVSCADFDLKNVTVQSRLKIANNPNFDSTSIPSSVVPVPKNSPKY